jgi:hypothetical protein
MASWHEGIAIRATVYGKVTILARKLTLKEIFNMNRKGREP